MIGCSSPTPSLSKNLDDHDGCNDAQAVSSTLILPQISARRQPDRAEISSSRGTLETSVAQVGPYSIIRSPAALLRSCRALPFESSQAVGRRRQLCLKRGVLLLQFGEL